MRAREKSGCLYVVKVMNVMLGRGLLELLPLYRSDLKLKHDVDIQGCLGFPFSHIPHVFLCQQMNTCRMSSTNASRIGKTL